MGTFRYKQYKEAVALGNLHVEVHEQPVYHSRIYTNSEKNNVLFEQAVAQISSTRLSNEDRLILDSFLDTYHYQQGCTRTYGIIYNSVIYDELAYLELANVSTYSKNANYLLDLSDCLDIIFSYMFGIPAEKVRQKIEEACKDYDFGYKLFSRAWITGETKLLKLLNLRQLYAIDVRIKEWCQKILDSKYSLSGMPRFAGMDLSHVGSGDLIIYMVRSQILLELQYILMQIMQQYGETKTSHDDCLLISRGMSHLLVESESEQRSFKFKFQLGLKQYSISACQYQKFGYLQQLLGGHMNSVNLVEG